MKALSFDKQALVFDTASKRIEDVKNGFLRVFDNPFTREQVVQYRGYEIPDWQSHGLERDKLYNVYRPAKELERLETVESLNGIPLLLEHETYDPDSPPVKRQIGSAGTDAKWVPPYLTNSLIFTNTKAINLLKSGAMKELSLGYYYDPVFKKGTAPNGQAYDVMMTNIIANHIALVEEGRAGHDVAVHDSKPKDGLRGKLTMDQQNQLDALKAAMAQGFASIQSALDVYIEAQANVAQASATDSEEVCDNDEEETVVDPATPENGEQVDTEDEDEEPNLDEADEQAQDEEEEQAQDEADDEPTADEDDEATTDEDEEQAEDSDEEGIEAALVEAGLSDASDDVKKAFALGWAESNKASKVVAKDSKKNYIASAMAAQVKREVRKAVHDARLQDKAKIKAASEVRAVLGAVDPMAFDSAGAIYKRGLLKVGYNSKAVKRMSGNEARAAFRGARLGCNAAKRLANDAKPRARATKSDAGLAKIFSMVK